MVHKGGEPYMISTKLLLTNNRGFSYINLGSGYHFRPSKRLWIKTSGNEQKVSFPLKGMRVIETKKGNLVAKKDSEYTTYLLCIPCGYRGETNIAIKEEGENSIIHQFPDFQSERGNLGVSKEVLVSVKRDERIIIEFSRTGRLYGRESHGTIVFEFNKWYYEMGLNAEEIYDIEKEIE